MSASPEQVLQRILSDLQSGNQNAQLAAIRDAGRLNYSSEAVVQALERLAVQGSAAVRQSALDVLDAAPSQHVKALSLKHLKRSEREAILAEIEDWGQRGLIEPEQAEVLNRRYGATRKPVAAPVEMAQPEAAPPAKPEATAPSTAKPAPAAPGHAAPAPAARPTLSERLLSQTASNIALYLGAFLVIGAAIILAALVEVTRLPILLGVTLLFGAGSIALKRRLPQPSYILFMVFSVLLPISANVVAQTLKLRSAGLDLYWTLVFLFMAAIWGFGTRLYTSRLFSLAAFAVWCLAFYRFPTIFDADFEWQALSLILASIGGLVAVQVTRRGKDPRLAAPLFLASQLVTAGTLLVSFIPAVIDLFEPAASEVWIACALTLLAAATFYGLSAYLQAAPIFAWIAAGCLLPISVLVLGAFKATVVTQAVGLAAWATLLATASELAHRSAAKRVSVYEWPLLLGAPPLYMLAAAVAFVENDIHGAPLAYAFGILLCAAVVAAVLMVLRPRGFVWVVALMFGLGAYFTFLALPFLQSLELYGGYTLLLSSLLLLLPELFFRSPFTARDPWRWPPFWLGVLMTSLSMQIVMLDVEATPASRAVIMAVFAALFAAYALHLRRPWIGYLGIAAATVAATYALQQQTFNAALAGLTLLAAGCFVSGTFLRGEQRAWGSMLRIGGLALGIYITAAWIFANPNLERVIEWSYAGYSVLVIGALFFAETYLRPNDRLESLGPLLTSLAAFLLLRRYGIDAQPYHLLAFSLIWLGADLVFDRTLGGRRLAVLTQVIGGVLTLANVWYLVVHGTFDGQPDESAWMFITYAVFFGVSAWLYRQARLTIAAYAALALAAIMALVHFDYPHWLPVLTGLAVLYFAAGDFLRVRAEAWGSALRLSGLVLGGLVSAAGLAGGEPHAQWYALIASALFLVETYRRGGGRLEIFAPALLSLAAIPTLRELDLDRWEYMLLAASVIWLGADAIYHRTLPHRRWYRVTRIVGGLLAAICMAGPIGGWVGPGPAAVTYGVLALFFAVYAWLYGQPFLGYAATASLPLAAYFGLKSVGQDNWLYAVGAIALAYYAAGYLLRRAGLVPGWARMLLLSGLGLGVINSVSAVMHIRMESAFPVAVAATLFAVEAFAQRNVWLAFPANALYLWSYFLILMDLKVDQPQFFSVGAALLGILMHYLLTRSGSHRGAFITGMFSQLVLLGTTFVQLLSTAELAYFIVIFFQGLAVLAYGIVIRSRSLLITPILFIVAAVLAVIYGTLKGIATVVLIGCTGIILLLLGIAAVILRERIARLGERMGDWQA